MSNYSVSLKGIGVENFKAFGKYQHFELAPITIITGQNNSGKSALVAALELLSKNDIYSHLDFHEGGLDIGDSSQVRNSTSGLNQFIFELDFIINPNPKFEKNVILHVTKEFSLRLVYEIGHPKSFIKTMDVIMAGKSRLSINFEDSNNSSNEEQNNFNSKIDFEYFLSSYLAAFEKEYEKSLAEKDGSSIWNAFQTGFKADSFVTNDYNSDSFDGNFFKTDDLNQYLSLKNVEKLIVKKLSESIDIDCIVSRNDNKLLFCPSNLYSYNNDSLGKIDGIINELLSLEHYFEDDYGPSEENRFGVSIIEHLENNGEIVTTKEKEINTEYGQESVLWPICPKFSDLFENYTNVLCSDIQKIMSLARNEVQRTLKLEALRATNDRIYSHKQKQIPLTREIINAADNSNKSELNEFLIEWTGSEKFDFFEKPEFKKIEGVGYRFVVTKNGFERELPDLGFGTRQVLPVILGVFNNKQIPFIIEEPESNLHPRLQSLLADLFVKVKMENPDSPLIIETHSEYLIRKLQYLVAKGNILAENITLSYISIKDGELTVQKMEIRKDGILKNDFGSGFFDESVRLTMDLLTLQSKN